MARPVGNVYASHETTIEDVRQEFLAPARAKNLATRTIGGYDRHTLGFLRWCASQGLGVGARSARLAPGRLHHLPARGRRRAAHRPRSRSDRQGARALRFPQGLHPDRDPAGLHAAEGPQVIIEAFNDDQLRALLTAPDQRRWVGLVLRSAPEARGRGLDDAGVRQVDLPFQTGVCRTLPPAPTGVVNRRQFLGEGQVVTAG